MFVCMMMYACMHACMHVYMYECMMMYKGMGYGFIATTTFKWYVCAYLQTYHYI